MNPECLSCSTELIAAVRTVRSSLASWLLALAATLSLLLAPALWNGYAVVFHDTGGYVGSVLEWRLFPGRSFFYGFFLWLTSLGWLSFWGPVAVQSLLTAWTIRLMLRCHGLAAGPLALSLHCAGLALLTGISWYTSQLMPDILVPLVVLAYLLLGLHWQALRPAERAGLAAMALLGLLSHMSCLALAIGLVMVTLVIRLVARWRHWPVQVLVWPGATLAAAAMLLMPAVHSLLFQHPGFTPGGPAFLYGRLVQDGLAHRWLADHCPADGVKLCDLRQRLPHTADEFLWADSSPFRDLGSWEPESQEELARLVRATVTAYPAAFVWNSLQFTAAQLVKVATGDGLDEHHLATRGVLTEALPHSAQPYTEARQQQGQVTRRLFKALNLIHLPVAWFATAALPLLGVLGLRARRFDRALLAFILLTALVGNAFICGALSNPHDRYQSRVVWIAALAVAMAMADRGRSGEGATLRR